MTPRPKLFRAAVLAAALAFASVPAAPSADAGLRDTLENVRDAVGCTAKAVFNPMNVFESGMRDFERMTGEEYDRKANRSVKEALEECTAAAENIVARGLGVEKLAGKTRDLAGKVGGTVETVKNAVSKVSEWFDKEKETAPPDGRMALSVSGPERRFYEEETGVLGGSLLPEPDRATKRPAGEAWRDPWGDEGRSSGEHSSWDSPSVNEPDPWGSVVRPEPTPQEYERTAFGDDSHDGEPGYAHVIGSEDGYENALDTLERLEAERRRAEIEAARLERERREREIEAARLERERREREIEAARLERERREREEAERILELDAEHRRREAARREARDSHHDDYDDYEDDYETGDSGDFDLFGSGDGYAEQIREVLEQLSNTHGNEAEAASEGAPYDDGLCGRGSGVCQ